MTASSFDPIRERIKTALRLFFQEKKSELARLNSLGPDASDRLLEFTLGGKMIRGCLVNLGYSVCGGSRTGAASAGAVITAGAAMELFQSGLLVHDDIMDGDLLRRGKPSIFQQYAQQAAREGHADPPRVGEALGICAGDVAYFLAFELLARMEAPPPVIAEVLGLCARELTAVGVAQMQDVVWGASRRDVSDEDILKMYTFKTGRYSFCLPLKTGGLFAGAGQRLLGLLESLGESLGLLFQIRDDELGVFGDEQELGKPVGSDVREGKKTLFRARLMAAARAEERRRLEGIFGNPNCSKDDLEYVRGLASRHGVRERIGILTRSLMERASAVIEEIDPGEGDREALRSLLDFTTARRQ